MQVPVNSLDVEKNTPLHLAFSIFSKDIEASKKICLALLHFKIDPNLKNKDLWTPLHVAVRKGAIILLNPRAN